MTRFRLTCCVRGPDIRLSQHTRGLDSTAYTLGKPRVLPGVRLRDIVAEALEVEMRVWRG